MTAEQDDFIIRLKLGDENAYRMLFDDYYVMLCKMATEWVEDDFIAETLVNDVIFNIWKKRDTLVVESSLRNYLIRSVRNASINHLRSAVNRHEISFSKMDQTKVVRIFDTHADGLPTGKLIEQELEQKLQDALERLPVETQKVFVLCRFERRTYAETAETLQVSVNTVKYHLKNAIRILKEQFSDYLSILLFLGSLKW